MSISRRAAQAVLLLLIVLTFGCGHSHKSAPPAASGKPTLAELQKKLAEMLPAYKHVATTPSVPADATSDLSAVAGGGGSVNLQWTEKNVGDYDLNGEVGISDLGPLALRYGRMAPFADPLDAVCDGNNDGSIDIADLQPVAAYYGNKITGYRVARWNNGTSAWVFGPTVARPGLGPNGWPVYTYNDPAPLLNSWYCVQPTDGAGYIGVPSNIVAAPGTVGLPPAPPTQVSPPPPADFHLPVGGVQNFTIPSTHTYSIDTSGGSEKYLIVFYSLNEAATTDTTYNLGVTRGTSTLMAEPKVPAVAPPYSDFLSPTERAEAEFWQRYYEKERENAVWASAHPEAILRKHVLVAGNQGDTHPFHVTFAQGGPTTVTATCVRYTSGDNVKIWVDNVANDGRISSADLDRVYSQVKTQIAPKENATYGQPDYIGGINSVDILMTAEINKLPGFIRGMFYSGDLLTSADSNQSAMVYTEVPDTGPVYFDPQVPYQTPLYMFEDNITSTVAHENQHLRNAGNRFLYLQAHPSWGLIYEEPWLDEGLAHFTEDFTGFQPQNNFLSPDFFMTTCYVRPLDTATGGVDVYRRGAAYMFVRYLVDRKTSSILPTLLDRDLAFAPLAGEANVANATGESFAQLYGEWVAAMPLSGTGLNADARYNYAPIATDPSTFVQTGIALRAMNTPYYPSGNSQDGPYLMTEPVYFPLINSMSVAAHHNAPIYFLVANPTAVKTTIAVTVDPANPHPLNGVAIRLADGAVGVNSAAAPYACNLKQTYIGYLANSSSTQTWRVSIPLAGSTTSVRLASADPANFTPTVQSIAGGPPPTVQNYANVPGVFYMPRLEYGPGFITSDYVVGSQSGSGWYAFTVYAP